jgi:hypothetical protein
MSFEGGCHCGAIKFTVDAPLPTQALSCNCSYCRIEGALLAFFPAGQFTLEQGEDALSSYRFNTHKIEHRFCSKCGSHPFSFGVNPSDGAPMRAVNLRCVKAVDLDGLTVRHYDGASS